MEKDENCGEESRTEQLLTHGNTHGQTTPEWRGAPWRERETAFRAGPYRRGSLAVRADNSQLSLATLAIFPPEPRPLTSCLLGCLEMMPDTTLPGSRLAAAEMRLLHVTALLQSLVMAQRAEDKLRWFCF